MGLVKVANPVILKVQPYVGELESTNYVLHLGPLQRRVTTEVTQFGNLTRRSLSFTSAQHLRNVVNEIQ